MTLPPEWNPNAPGNKGIPAPRDGYEQRKVALLKLHNARSKGWEPCVIDGRNIVTTEWILCERRVEGVDETLDKTLPPTTEERTPHRYVDGFSTIEPGIALDIKDEDDTNSI